MPKGGIRWVSNTINPRLVVLGAAIEQGLQEILEVVAQAAEEHMKAEAPWEDQTGAAREGLGADLERGVGHANIWLYHTVDYGIWLEVRWSGQYAIIQPTLEWLQQILPTYTRNMLESPAVTGRLP